MINAADEMRRRKPAAENRKKRENHQRNRHILRRFVDMNFVLVKSLLAKKCEEYESEHVKRR